MNKFYFDCCGNLYEGTQLCDRKWFEEQLDSDKVRQAVETYRFFRREVDKKALPALIPHAHFPNGKRCADQAVPSGLLMLDIDNHEGLLQFDPRKHYEQYIEPLLSTTLKHVLMVYITPSGAGLRVIAKRQRCSDDLYQEQQELFALMRGTLPLDALDKSCHDLSRLSFITSREDMLYLNADELFEGEVSEGFEKGSVNCRPLADESVNRGVIAAEPLHQNRALGSDQEQRGFQNGTSLDIRPEVATRISPDGLYYGEVAYADIVKELVRVDALKLKAGSRNKDIYRLSCQLRSICRSEEHLQAVLPYTGLTVKEVTDTVHSACHKLTADDPMDPILVRVLDMLDANGEQTVCPEPQMPERLPHGIREIVAPYAPSHQPAMVMCALPMLGALATRLRIQYLNDEVHSAAFQTVLVAEQGTGKGTMSKMHKLLMGQLIEQDDKNRALMDDWRDERDAAGESGAGPRHPHLPIRNLNPRTTFPEMIDMMKDAKGQHLFICAPEIDSVPDNQWFQRGSTLRLAFDNERGGQDTKSVKATSGYIPFYLNVCLSGTPSTVMNRYKNAEDGLVSRTIFATFPAGERGKKRQADQKRTPRNARIVNELIEMLMNYGVNDKKECEPVRLPKIERAILEWYDMKGDLYNMTKNESIEVFRTRAAVIGMRAGALAWLCEGKKENRVAIEFARYVAEYTLYYQMKFFGEKLDEAVLQNNRVLTGRSFTSNDIIFAKLDDQFTNTDVSSLFRARGKQGTGASQTCHRWLENEWVVSEGRGVWRKTSLGKQRADMLKQSISV